MRFIVSLFPLCFKFLSVPFFLPIFPALVLEGCPRGKVDLQEAINPVPLPRTSRAKELSVFEEQIALRLSSRSPMVWSVESIGMALISNIRVCRSVFLAISGIGHEVGLLASDASC
jgi:hypothetical protein